MSYETELGLKGHAADSEIAALNASLTTAINANADLLAEVQRFTLLEAELKATITAKNATIMAQDAEIARLKALIPVPPPVTPPATTRPPVPTGWKVENEDWFEKPTVDPVNWTPKVGPLGAPREEYNTARPQNIQTGKGLDIFTLREAYQGKAWTSGYLSSSGLKMTWDATKDVRIEVLGVSVSDLLNDAAGIWPAPGWLRFNPGIGEIDLAELYGWPFGTARTNATENAAQRGNFSATIHNDTSGTPAKMVLQPKNVAGGNIPPGTKQDFACEITSVGISAFWNGQPIVDAYNRDSTLTWAQLAANPKGAINRSSFAGRGHVRIQTQVGSSYWGPSNAQTKNASLHIDGVRILVRP